MSYIICPVDIVLQKSNVIISVSEGEYQAKALKGCTIFWQTKKAPEECRGILKIKKGINYMPWVKLSFVYGFPVSSLYDRIYAQYLNNCNSFEEGVKKFVDLINSERDKKGFFIPGYAIKAIQKSSFGNI